MSPPQTPIRFGCCGSMIAPNTDPVGADFAAPLAALGYDYIELSLRDLAGLSESALANLQARLRGARIACETCNNFFPPEIRLTGPAADLPKALRYAEKALALAARLGVKVVVFGSSGARNVPDGFSAPAAWTQLRVLLYSLAPIAESHGMTIAIEHLNRGESNILNTVAEAYRMAREVAHPRIRLLVDAYHLRQENESSEILAKVAHDIAHVHVAERAERVFPTSQDPWLADFFAHLTAAGYAGRCSIEANTRNFAADAASALKVCRKLASGNGADVGGVSPPR